MKKEPIRKMMEEHIRFAKPKLVKLLSDPNVQSVEREGIKCYLDHLEDAVSKGESSDFFGYLPSTSIRLKTTDKDYQQRTVVLNKTHLDHLKSEILWSYNEGGQGVEKAIFCVESPDGTFEVKNGNHRQTVVEGLVKVKALPKDFGTPAFVLPNSSLKVVMPVLPVIMELLNHHSQALPSGLTDSRKTIRRHVKTNGLDLRDKDTYKRVKNVMLQVLGGRFAEQTILNAVTAIKNEKIAEESDVYIKTHDEAYKEFLDVHKAKENDEGVVTFQKSGKKRVAQLVQISSKGPEYAAALRNVLKKKQEDPQGQVYLIFNDTLKTSSSKTIMKTRRSLFRELRNWSYQVRQQAMGAGYSPPSGGSGHVCPFDGVIIAPQMKDKWFGKLCDEADVNAEFSPENPELESDWTFVTKQEILSQWASSSTAYNVQWLHADFEVDQGNTSGGEVTQLPLKEVA